MSGEEEVLGDGVWFREGFYGGGVYKGDCF